MRHTTRKGFKLVHARYVVDLLRTLIRKNIGTSSVEEQCKMLCNSLPYGKKCTMVRTITKWKLNDAEQNLRKEQYINTTEWRKSKRDIAEAGVLYEYERMWCIEKSRTKRDLKEKMRRKEKFLERKYGKVKEVPDEVEGIDVTDKEIPPTFTSSPVCYGGCVVNSSENKLLMLPPRFAVYSKINPDDCEAEVEKGLAKLRWSRRHRTTVCEDDKSDNNVSGENGEY